MTVFLAGLPKPDIFTVSTGISIAVGMFAVIIAVCVCAKTASLPVKTVSVKLIEKKKMPMPHLAYVLSLRFLTDDGKLIEVFADSELQYDFYNEGDTGNLTFKGSKLIKFERLHINPPSN